MTARPRCASLDAMNRHLMLVSLAVLATALGTALAVARPGSASGTTLTLHVSGTKLAEVDVPPLVTSKTSPESPGDELIGVSRLSGSARGTRYLACAVAKQGGSVETALYDCRVTYVLSGGTIVAEGVVHVARTSVAAIVGGTGAYAGASGTLTASPAGVDRLAVR